MIKSLLEGYETANNDSHQQDKKKNADSESASPNNEIESVEEIKAAILSPAKTEQTQETETFINNQTGKDHSKNLKKERIIVELEGLEASENEITKNRPNLKNTEELEKELNKIEKELQNETHADNIELPKDKNLVDKKLAENTELSLVKPDSKKVQNQQLTFTPETPSETARKSGLAFSAGISLFASVIFMMVLGWFADLYAGFSPWGIIGGITIGALIGFVQFFRTTRQIINPSPSSFERVSLVANEKIVAESKNKENDKSKMADEDKKTDVNEEKLETDKKILNDDQNQEKI